MTIGEIIGTAISIIVAVGGAFGFMYNRISSHYGEIATMKEKITQLEDDHKEYSKDVKRIFAAVNDSTKDIITLMQEQRKEFKEDIREIKIYINKV
jgi:archaellum component FlaC